jgi:DNA polymerase III delta prime subunit
VRERHPVDLIFIYGPPGVGKLTVANHLAKLTGCKLFHNHVSIDCVLPVFDFGTEPFWKLVHEIRCQVLAEAAIQGTDLILTNVYYHPEDDERVTRYFRAVELNGGHVRPVQLRCEPPIIEARVEAAGRAEMGKIATVAGLRRLFEEHDLLKPVPGRESLTIDNTHLDPAEVAARIVAHYKLRRQS